MPRTTDDLGLPTYDLADAPNGVTQTKDLRDSIRAVIVHGDQAATLPPVAPARRLLWHTGALQPYYSDGTAWRPMHGMERRTVASSTTLVLADTGRSVDVSAASAATVTIPTQLAAGWLDGTVVQVARRGAGTVSIAGASGVTLLAAPGVTDLVVPNSVVELQRVAANQWMVLPVGGRPVPWVATLPTATNSYNGMEVDLIADPGVGAVSWRMVRQTGWWTFRGGPPLVGELASNFEYEAGWTGWRTGATVYLPVGGNYTIHATGQFSSAASSVEMNVLRSGAPVGNQSVLLEPPLGRMPANLLTTVAVPGPTALYVGFRRFGGSGAITRFGTSISAIPTLTSVVS